MKQLTIRGFDPKLQRRLRELARAEGISLNQAALRLLRSGAGFEQTRVGTDRIGAGLGRFFGTWSEQEAREFEECIRDQEQIDEDMWR